MNPTFNRKETLENANSLNIINTNISPKVISSGRLEDPSSLIEILSSA